MDTIEIAIPAWCRQPAHWVLHWLFDEVLGLPALYRTHDSEQIEIRWRGRVLTLENDFFRRHLPVWRQEGALLIDPPSQWVDVAATLAVPLERPSIPVLWGAPGLVATPHGAHLKLDVVGSIFFMLARYEEVIDAARDRYDRFPASAALAVQRGFLQRPLVDEYTDILWAALRSVWPGLTRKAVAGMMRVSCDVDEPYERWIRNPWRLAQGVAGALLRKRSPGTAATRLQNAWRSRRGDYRHDPHWTFDWYMTQLEETGNRGAFYFIATPGRTRYDCAYALEEPRMQQLLAQIAARGHEIGLHGSFNTYRDGAQLAAERQRLRAACITALADAGSRAGAAAVATAATAMATAAVPAATAAVRGNRQHYLRWDTAVTPDLLAQAGFDYDASGGFPYDPGFRHGTAREFPMWSWQKQGPLRLRQRPLMLMEAAVLSGPADAALATMVSLKRTALRYGDFNLLWHNSRFTAPGDRALFRQILDA
ncbi:hypothetical protein ASF61_13685 [Duganella sp. Leaf126]|uniref:polysaccharide deacetylase family protein n=1 Tax=Duganella sp. Leaf126 TaxID=1736266 RepID=UPI0006F32A13|nr:polysaccharide deacetylase family protein [Duganella sp. Leaf126]KQQ32600.1 hypothetical protein ASF61_13685 [Duganella sp. Leaf126]